MTVNSEKNDSVSTIADLLQSSSSPPKKSFESPVISPANKSLTPVNSRWSFSSSKKSFGSKDETFFDSHQWLQSDSDDDFHSVNGDFTPSRPNTPRRSFSDKPSRFQNFVKPPEGSSSPPPQPRRKKLGELFRDSIREESSEGSSSTLSTPYLSGASSGEFNDDAIEENKKKLNRQYRRCLPGLYSCGGGFLERRKKMSSETVMQRRNNVLYMK